MTEDRARSWDVGVKVFAVVATLIGIWAGYRQFLAQFELSNRRPFLEMQAKYYVEMLETASKIAYPADDKERQDSARRFWQLYSGTSALVEDRNVEDKLDSLSLCVGALGSKCAQWELEAQTTGLSMAIKQSLGRSWGIVDPEESRAASAPAQRASSRRGFPAAASAPR